MVKNIVLLLLFCLMHLTTQSQPSPQTGDIYVCPPCNSLCDKEEHDKPGVCKHCNMPLILKADIKNYEQPRKKKIAFYLQDGVEVLDFAGPMEVFTYAGYEVFTVSKTKDVIMAQRIMKVVPDYDIEDAPKADILAFFGGNALAAAKDPAVTGWVKAQEDVESYFSVCTGALILAEAGILKNKKATTFHNTLDYLEANYPDTEVLKNVRYVDNGNVITTAGISAGIDGALHLVAKHQGFNAARKAVYYMEYDKWLPGEGLILTDENPYAEMPGMDELKAYAGSYRSGDNGVIDMAVDEQEKSIYAIIEEKRYPLFHTDGDKFITLDETEVVFVREGTDITGFMDVGNDNKIYNKVE